MAPGEPYTLEDLAALTAEAGPSLLARLTELEIAGLVEVSAGRFHRNS
jgi:predicted Rossmann fold nucleotide-binding protein DprA/Smf involved in DNA uptake